MLEVIPAKRILMQGEVMEIILHKLVLLMYQVCMKTLQE